MKPKMNKNPERPPLRCPVLDSRAHIMYTDAIHFQEKISEVTKKKDRVISDPAFADLIVLQNQVLGVAQLNYGRVES